jgi:hypothetical protein
MYRDNREEMKNFYHWYHSKKKFDYICRLGAHQRCDPGCDIDHKYYWSNIPFSNNLSYKNNARTIGCFGCSITYGLELKEKDTWPVMLSEQLNTTCLNFGVPGAGVDGIYMNLVQSKKDYAFKKVIILLPNLSRRVARMNNNGNWFRWVAGLRNNGHVSGKLLPTPIHENLNLKDEYFDEVARQVTPRIIKDVDNKYSKKILKKMIDFCRENFQQHFFTSWDTDAYDYLKTNLEQQSLLPFYNLQGPTTPDGLHPTRMQNERFVEQIRKKIL